MNRGAPVLAFVLVALLGVAGLLLQAKWWTDCNAEHGVLVTPSIGWKIPTCVEKGLH